MRIPGGSKNNFVGDLKRFVNSNFDFLFTLAKIATIIFMKFLDFSSRAIEYLFYSLFLLVPLVFTGITSELFEFSKMWVTFGIAIAIGFFWLSKMIIAKQVIFKRTILDIPIFLFLLSQIISTVISLDPYVSLWGYYSRWNGGLLSIITYIFLFYAFISNFAHSPRDTRDTLDTPDTSGIVRRSLIVSIISGFIVILWALPSHFGYDPTCLLFRGTLDVSCWTNDFVPRVRIFGPLGQPDWLAGYLGVLLPITGAFILNTLRNNKKLFEPRLLFYALSLVLFYLALLYTGSKSGIISGILSLFVLFSGYAVLNRKNPGIIKNKFVLGLLGILLIVSFFAGIRIPVVEKFSFSQVQNILTKPDPLSPRTKITKAETPSSQPLGGSNSFQIRLVVWRGAVAVWRANPIIGSGVETFAYSYYKHRPIEHNRLSEWNFLYNKAHNEYLNYLATTGAFGLLTYLSFIGLFLVISGVNIINSNKNFLKPLKSDIGFDKKDPLVLSLVASFLSILMINFFGFSVVILNIYLFLIPAFILIILNLINNKNQKEISGINYISYGQWAIISFLGIAGLFMIGLLIRYWIADTKYALGYNYNRVQELQTAYPLLHDAVKLRNEPVFLDEMAINDAFIAAGLMTQNSTESAQVSETLINEAISTSNKLVKEHPNNIVFWKSRVRILYTLSAIDQNFLPQALEAIKKTEVLAPTDASVLYNLGVIYGQNNDTKNAVRVLEKTIEYKPDYREAHFALGLFYHDLSINKSGAITDLIYHEKAINEMKYVLEKINPSDQQAKESLDLWEKER